MGSFGEDSVISKNGQNTLKKAIFVSVLKKLIILIPAFIAALISNNVSAHPPDIGGAIIFMCIGICVAVAIVFVVKAEYKFTNLPAYRENENLRIRIADKIRKMSLNGLNEYGLTGLSGILVNDGAIMEGMLSRMIPELWSSFIAMPICCFALACVNIPLALAAYLTIPAAVALLMGTLGIQKRLTDKQIPAKQAASAALMEYICGMKEAKSFGITGEKNKDLKEKLSDLKKKSFRMETMSGVLVAWSDVIMEIGVGIVVFLAALFLNNGSIGIFTAVLFFVAVFCVYGPAAKVLTTIPTIMYMNKGMKRMKDMLDKEEIGGESEPDIKDFSVELENIDLKFNGKNILKDISFKAENGKITAIVGSSGSGKTSLCNIISGFFVPSGGRLLIGGEDVSCMKQEHYMKFVSAVFQDVVLFNDTILENIRAGRPGATDEETLEAARLACCDEFIKKREKAYDTVLTENGSDLSGGERQRISIARALLKNAPVIILDEATAALDAENETKVQQAIANLAENKTVIIIAHRLRNVTNAQKIIVLNEGHKEAEGTHDELIKTSHTYKKLCDLQEKSLKNVF